jgi:hypothetical protein
MRAAAYFAGAIVVVGIYLVIAAALTFSPMWIALGLLAIAVMTAIAMLVTAEPAPRVEMRSSPGEF